MSKALGRDEDASRPGEETRLLATAQDVREKETVLSPAALPTRVEQEHASPRLPERVGSFEIERELARGGMGVVYVAHDPHLGRRVALKVLRGRFGGKESLERFRFEAHAAARLQHPGIVGIHEVGEAEGWPYLVMDLVEGESLRDRLARVGALEPRAAAWIVRRLAEAVYYAHTCSVLHRDIKPANVILGPDDAPVLIDFGLAREVDQHQRGLTESGHVLGTPAYMPPEQAAGALDRVDRRSDVYALGATLYETLVARPPSTGKGRSRSSQRSRPRSRLRSRRRGPRWVETWRRSASSAWRRSRSGAMTRRGSWPTT